MDNGLKATFPTLHAQFEVDDLAVIDGMRVDCVADNEVEAQLGDQDRTLSYIVIPFSMLALGILFGAPGKILGIIAVWYLLVSTVNGYERWSKRRSMKRALYIQLIAAKAHQREGEPLAPEARHRLDDWSVEALANLWSDIGRLEGKRDVPIAQRVLRGRR